MKKIAITLLALAYASCLFAQVAEPSPTGQSKIETQRVQNSMQHRFWQNLQLTDDQKEKLKQIREVGQYSLRSAWAQVETAQVSLHLAILTNPENAADIQTKATKLASALSKESTQVARYEAKVNQVLTAAQRGSSAFFYLKMIWEHRVSELRRNPWLELQEFC